MEHSGWPDLAHMCALGCVGGGGGHKVGWSVGNGQSLAAHPDHMESLVPYRQEGASREEEDGESMLCRQKA